MSDPDLDFIASLDYHRNLYNEPYFGTRSHRGAWILFIIVAAGFAWGFYTLAGSTPASDPHRQPIAISVPARTVVRLNDKLLRANPVFNRGTTHRGFTLYLANAPLGRNSFQIEEPDGGTRTMPFTVDQRERRIIYTVRDGGLVAN